MCLQQSSGSLLCTSALLGICRITGFSWVRKHIWCWAGFWVKGLKLKVEHQHMHMCDRQPETWSWHLRRTKVYFHFILRIQFFFGGQMLEGSTEGKEFAYTGHWDLVQHQQQNCHSCGSGSWIWCDSVSVLILSTDSLDLTSMPASKQAISSIFSWLFFFLSQHIKPIFYL